jgi:pre-rRNA-processing protein TSR3
VRVKLFNVIVIQHRKERASKCSLRPLKSFETIKFYRYPLRMETEFSKGYALSFEGPLLSPADHDAAIVVFDATWRYAQKMQKHPSFNIFEQRSLDFRWKTAYPRRQHDCKSPSKGLASVEALYAALLQIGQVDENLLNHYYWRVEFLKINEELIKSLKGVRSKC